MVKGLGGLVPPERVSAHTLRLVAPNPSPMTLEGTNTYIVAAPDRSAMVIDPGPPLPDHIDTIVSVARDEGLAIRAILVTHGHPDHAPGAVLLRERTGAPVYAHPEARFPHDVAVRDGQAITVQDRLEESAGGGVRLAADYAVGHARDHLVFWLEDDGALFTGDVVVGRGTVVVAPPGGDMRAYQKTLARLRERYGHAGIILGGHGAPVHDARKKLDEYIAHRIEREEQIRRAMEGAPPLTVPQIVERVYTDTPEALWPAAGRQVMAYLDALEREGYVRSHDVQRQPTTLEERVLHPDLVALVDEDSAAVARAELGFDDADAQLHAYERVT